MVGGGLRGPRPAFGHANGVAAHPAPIPRASTTVPTPDCSRCWSAPDWPPARWLAPAGRAGLLLLLGLTDDMSDWLYNGGFLLVALVAAIVLAAVVARPEGFVARGLAWAPIVLWVPARPASGPRRRTPGRIRPASRGDGFRHLGGAARRIRPARVVLSATGVGGNDLLFRLSVAFPGVRLHPGPGRQRGTVWGPTVVDRAYAADRSWLPRSSSRCTC